MFMAELSLYINFVKEQLENENNDEPDRKRKKYYAEFFKNLLEGITYYKNLPRTVERNYETFTLALNIAESTLEELGLQYFN